jgi:polyhydroxyalkanoate synthesis regulator phasin
MQGWVSGDILKEYGVDRYEIERGVREGVWITNEAGVKEIEARYLGVWVTNYARRYGIGVEVVLTNDVVEIARKEIEGVVEGGLRWRVREEVKKRVMVSRWVERVEGMVKTNGIDRWDIEGSIRRMYGVVGEAFCSLTNEWAGLDVWGVTNSWLGRYLGSGEVELEVRGVMDGYLRLLVDVRKREEGIFVRKALLDDDSLRWYAERGSGEYYVREEVRKLEEALEECPEVEGMSEEEFLKWREEVRGKYLEGVKKWDELFEKMREGMDEWMKVARKNFEEGEKYWKDGYRYLVKKRYEWTKGMEERIKAGVKEWEKKSKERKLGLEEALKELEEEIGRAVVNYGDYLLQMQEVSVKSSVTLGEIEESEKFLDGRIERKRVEVENAQKEYDGAVVSLLNLLDNYNSYVIMYNMLTNNSSTNSAYGDVMYYRREIDNLKGRLEGASNVVIDRRAHV